ncbi:MAG: hypothetical protein AAF639_24280, partial [Chloroflexota bacterium]
TLFHFDRQIKTNSLFIAQFLPVLKNCQKKFQEKFKKEQKKCDNCCLYLQNAKQRDEICKK